MENQKTTQNVGSSTFNFDEPASFDEMIQDLKTVGCNTIITLPTAEWNLRRGLSYNDALQLARKASFIGVTSNKDIAFIFYLDGGFWIWVKNSPITPPSNQFEKIEIQSALCVYNSSSPKHWKITMMVKNTGTATATIDKVFLNGIEVNDYGDTAPPDEGEASVSFGSSGLTLPSGSSSTFYIYIDADEGGSDEGWESVSSGTTINIKLHSAGGMEYLKMVELV